MTNTAFPRLARWGRFALLLVAVWALSGLSPGWAGPLITVELPAVEDSTLRQNAPAGNFSKSGILAVRSYKPGHHDDDDDDRTPGPKNWRSVIRFDLSALPPNSVVESATLELFMKKAPKKSRAYQVHRLTADWSERFVSWLNRGEGIAWGEAGSDFVATPTASVSTGTKSKVTLSWNVTGDVSAWLAGVENSGFVVKDAAENSSKNYTAHFISSNREHGHHSSRTPRLVVAIRPVFEVSGLGATAGDGSVVLNWTNPNPPFVPPASFFDGVLVIRKVGSAPEPILVDGVPYPVGSVFLDGSQVIDTRPGALGAFETLTDSDVTNGTTYFYRVVTFNPSLGYSRGVAVDATPIASPPGGSSWSFSLARSSQPVPATPPPIPVLGLDEFIFGDSFAGTNTFAITNANGSPLWAPASSQERVALTAINWTPVSGTGFTENRIITASSSGRVTAIDTASGTPVWSVTVAGVENVLSMPVTQVRDFSDPAFNAAHGTDLVYVASANLSTRNNTIVALRLTADPSNPVAKPAGSVAWQFTGTAAQPLDRVHGTPFIDFELNRLYVPSLAGPNNTQPSLWVFSTLDGTLLGQLALGPIASSVSVGFDFTTGALSTLYLGNNLGKLFAVSRDSLTLKWTGPSNIGSPLVDYLWQDFYAPSRLYFATTDGFVWALDDPGAGSPPDASMPVWKTSLPGASYPLLFDTVLYVSGGDGKVHQVRLANGADEAQVLVGNPGDTLSAPTTDYAYSKVVVGTSSGRVVSIPVPF